MKKYIIFIAFLVLYLLNSFNPNMMEQFYILKHYNMIGTLLRYLMALSFIFIPISLFYDNKNASSLVSYVSMPSGLLSLIFIKEITRHLNKNVGYFITIYVLLVLFITGYGIYSLIKHKGKCDIGALQIFLVAAILLIPLNILMAVKGHKMFFYKIFKTWYFIFLFLFFAGAFVLYYFLKDKDKDKREKILFILSLALLYHLFARFSYVKLHNYQDITEVWGALPFYVCSFGISLLPFAIISRNKVLQTFSFIINTPGAVIVFVNPSMGPNSIFNYDVTYFVISHLGLFAVASMLPIYLHAEVKMDTMLKSCGWLLLYFVFITLIDFSCFKFLGAEYNFSYVVTPPLPVDIKCFGILDIAGYKFSPVYIVILWLVHSAIGMITYYLYKYVIIKKININNEALVA